MEMGLRYKGVPKLGLFLFPRICPTMTISRRTARIRSWRMRS